MCFRMKLVQAFLLSLLIFILEQDKNGVNADASGACENYICQWGGGGNKVESIQVSKKRE